MTVKKKLLFYCQHVLGMGHFIRSAEIVRGLKDFDVFFLNGGEIVPGFDLPASVEVINLPPIKADAEFRDIHVAAGAQSLDEIKEARKQRILAEYERIKPDVLVIELFPFGRLKFAFELLPLLERSKAEGRTKIVCSLRDILVSKREQQLFEEEACRLFNQYFDLLLIHSDPRLQRLEETFPRATDLKPPIHYTGFVMQPRDDDDSALLEIDEWMATGEQKILVSIGGGRVGSELIDCAIESSHLLDAPHRMLIFTGPYLPEAEWQRLRNKTADKPQIRLARYTTQFLAHLRRADLSISMAGYNTCMNIIATGARAIVYPFTGNNNQEQTIRAHKLRALGLVEVIHGDELRPEQLAAQMAMLLKQPQAQRTAPALDLAGVKKTAVALNKLVALGRQQSSAEKQS